MFEIERERKREREGENERERGRFCQTDRRQPVIVFFY